ncbi:MAG TPA: response regulator [Chthoniobacterales bacterium]|nr:response regulator [Chthoniobacterales bacterium]
MKNRKPRILLVDDEESFTKVTQLTLTDYDIVIENDSARALERAREFKPDLILLDVMMPNFDGGDVAAQIRQEADLKQVPVVFLTALVTHKESAKRPVMGGYPFIAKPVTPELLAQKIEKHLRAAKPQ